MGKREDLRWRQNTAPAPSAPHGARSFLSEGCSCVFRGREPPKVSQTGKIKIASDCEGRRTVVLTEYWLRATDQQLPKPTPLARCVQGFASNTFTWGNQNHMDAQVAFQYTAGRCLAVHCAVTLLLRTAKTKHTNHTAPAENQATAQRCSYIII